MIAGLKHRLETLGIRTLVITALAGLAATAPARASSLQVSPISLEMLAPAAAATLTLHNGGSEPVNAQIRLYRWSQENGEDQLLPTEAVVASPPMTTLPPGAEYTLRVIRTAPGPVAAPEAYRLIVDEIPNGRARQSRSVALVVRYSIPVFFYPRYGAAAKLAWTIEKIGGRAFLAATNSGDQHVRLAELSVRGASGKATSFGKGLVGYVLGRSTMRWAAPGALAGLASGQAVSVNAQTNLGPIKASSIVRAAH